MRTNRLTRAAVALVVALAAAAPAAELGRFEIAEPLGRTWPDEWLTQQVKLDLGGRTLPAGRLRLEGPDHSVPPAQFYHRDGRLLAPEDQLTGTVRLEVLFKATVSKNQTAGFTVVDAPGPGTASVEVVRTAPKVTNGRYEVSFDPSRPLPINDLRVAGGSAPLGVFRWPDGVEPISVMDDWLEIGPARAVLRRTFRFKDPAHRYAVTLDFRADDPWIDITDEYALGPGSAVELDLAALDADTVYHPHTYNARTFKPDGKEEDSTLEPPQHPIATLGPIWRDIWFGGGPFAFVYNSKSPHGIGFATVRGSEWETPDGITPESQNLFVHGDARTPGRVRVEIPTDAGKRRWAIVIGPVDVRKNLGSLVRSRADVPLDKVLREWVLDWPSAAEPHSFGFAGAWVTFYNQHSLNPTTFPRRVRSHLDDLMKKGAKVKSRDLAVLAYVFTDPNYWPGPKYTWRIGNPNFHTDMYNIPLKVGLLMPDHPHAKRWVDYGVEETRGNLMRDSFPGGAWAESIGYSGFFFHVVDNARMLRDAGAARPFRDWPRFKEVATYLACMHTPVDPRYGERQKAPIGDTHPGSYTKQLRAVADLYRGIDDRLAGQLERFPEAWDGALDLGSREFYGFGAMLRGSPYDDRHESFVTIKAGPARNHFQGDELSFHFCALGTPLAIDYACHYSPRPWSASIHNRPDMDGLRPVALAARRAFKASPAADVFVADERTTQINHVPMEPHLATKPGWNYDTTTLPADTPWTMRRYAMLVKHDPARSRIADYLVIRDEIDSPRPPWWNLHVLAREVRRDGPRFHFPGQLDVDLTAHVLEPALGEVETREWGWSRERNRGSLKNWKGPEYEQEHFGHYIPVDFQRGTWDKDFQHSGEMAKWLRLEGPAGRSDWLVVLMPCLRGRPAPNVEKLPGSSLRVTLGDEAEVVHLGSAGAFQAAVERDGTTTTLLKPGEVKPWAELEFKPMPPDTDQGAR